MILADCYNRFQGHFVDVRLVDEDEFIKTVFQQSAHIDHGQITRSIVLADIVPEGDEELYIRKFSEDPDGFQKLPLTDSQVAEFRIGKRVPL